MQASSSLPSAPAKPYAPPPGAYSRKKNATTLAYFSGAELEEKLIANCNQFGMEYTKCPSHFAFSPFQVAEDSSSGHLHIYNCHNTNCGSLGPKPDVSLPEKEKYPLLIQFIVKDDVLTSFHYPTYVLGQVCQRKL